MLLRAAELFLQGFVQLTEELRFFSRHVCTFVTLASPQALITRPPVIEGEEEAEPIVKAPCFAPLSETKIPPETLEALTMVIEPAAPSLR